MEYGVRNIAAFVAGLTFIAALVPAVAQDSSFLGDRLTALFFAEVDYREREDKGDDGFIIGQGVAQFNFRFNQKFSLFTELTATSKKNADFKSDIERMFVRYDFSDQYKLSAGRYHTPLGYWNSSFHHGAWLQTTISRPQTSKYGSNIIPIHFVGVLIEGNIGESGFGYKAGFGNGRSGKINHPGDFSHSGDGNARLVALNYRGIGSNRFNAGISLYIDKIERRLEPEIDEELFNAYVAFEGNSPEIIIEYTHSNHDSSLGEGDVNSLYGQFAYRLRGRANNFKAYFRAEKIDVEDNNPLLGGLQLDYEGVIAGTKWDISPSIALKAEVRREEFDDDKGVLNSFWLQLTYVFAQ